MLHSFCVHDKHSPTAQQTQYRQEEARYLQAYVDLEGVIDTPLQTRQGTNHDNTQRQASGEQVEPAHILDDAANGGILAGVQLGHHVVSWVRDNRTEDTSNVSSSKGDSKLLIVAALLLWLWHNILVQSLDCVLKARCTTAQLHVSLCMAVPSLGYMCREAMLTKLHHGVRNLSSPQRSQTLP